MSEQDAIDKAWEQIEREASALAGTSPDPSAAMDDVVDAVRAFGLAVLDAVAWAAVLGGSKEPVAMAYPEWAMLLRARILELGRVTPRTE